MGHARGTIRPMSRVLSSRRGRTCPEQLSADCCCVELMKIVRKARLDADGIGFAQTP